MAGDGGRPPAPETLLHAAFFSGRTQELGSLPSGMRFLAFAHELVSDLSQTYACARRALEYGGGPPGAVGELLALFKFQLREVARVALGGRPLAGPIQRLVDALAVAYEGDQNGPAQPTNAREFVYWGHRHTHDFLHVLGAAHSGGLEALLLRYRPDSEETAFGIALSTWDAEGARRNGTGAWLLGLERDEPLILLGRSREPEGLLAHSVYRDTAGWAPLDSIQVSAFRLRV